eukprot:TRINITY_DN15875_c1_g1_i1.p1 TRINITY_DN15875_c1_g1~~TRINITY_DN15875_c1_g1_i1.p1  ORF type:complete len:997 (-),score=228.43 TRINITY_DN15875_c1_g1_i1:403-3393(-)
MRRASADIDDAGSFNRLVSSQSSAKGPESARLGGAVRTGNKLAQMQDETSTTLSAYFHEFSEADDLSGDSLLSYSRFLQFLAHAQLFTSTFDHPAATQLFLNSVQQDGRSGTQDDATAGDPTSDRPEALFINFQSFRGLIQALSRYLHGDASKANLRRQSTNTETDRGAGGVAALKRDNHAMMSLIKDMNLNRNTPFDPVFGGSVRGFLYVSEVLQAAYEYSQSIKKLWFHYATASDGSTVSDLSLDKLAKPRSKARGAVTCKSAYIFCRAVRLVPDVVVTGEFAELARGLLSEPPTPPEARYLDDRLMAGGIDGILWIKPSRAAPQNAEPRYDMPGFVELLLAIALWAPPRCLREAADVCVERVHHVFGEVLRLPKDTDYAGLEAFDVGAYLSSYGEATKDVAHYGEVGVTRVPKSADDVMDKLSDELPRLTPEQGPSLQGPPPGAKIQPQPLTVEEQAKQLRNLEKAKLPEKLLQKRKKEVQKLGKIQGPMRPGEVIWLAKRPEPKQMVVPPEHRRERRDEMFERVRQHMEEQRKEARRLFAPSTGWALQLTIIDEPLLAPACDECEQVTTTIETAIVSRRLRSYDIAIALLIKARRQWALTAAGRRPAPVPWKDVQPPVPAPSPWDAAAREAAARRGEEFVPWHPNIAGEAGLNLRKSVPSKDSAATRNPTMPPPAESPKSPKSPTAGFGEEAEDVFPSSADMSPSQEIERVEAWAEASPTQPSPSSEATQDEVDKTDWRYDPNLHFDFATGEVTTASGDGHWLLEHLPPEVNIFFYCELASLHSALREDTMAAQLLWLARKHADELPPGHPDAAFVWSGLGRIAFHVGNADVAARSLIRARKIREKTIGGDTIETATTYNNLACCLHALGRLVEANILLQLASEILTALAGDTHPRTQAVMRNLSKSKGSPQNIHCEVPNLFAYPLMEPKKWELKKTKKKAKKKGSKSRSRSGSRASSAGSRKSTTSKGSGKKKGGKGSKSPKRQSTMKKKG